MRRREFVFVVAFPIGRFLAVERVAVQGGSPGKDLKHRPRRSAFRLRDGGQIQRKSQEQQGDGSFYHAYPWRCGPYGRLPALVRGKKGLGLPRDGVWNCHIFRPDYGFCQPGLPCAPNRPFKSGGMRVFWGPAPAVRPVAGLDLALNRIVSCFRPFLWAFTRSRPPDVSPRGGGGQRLTGKNYACHP